MLCKCEGRFPVLTQKVPADDLLEALDSIAPDRTTITQDKFDLTNKYRSSLLPWRGQFSPELVELFLTHYSRPNATILDPFVGSGTTLFEAARMKLECYGAEINPSAVEMARTSQFVNLSEMEREETIEAAYSIIRAHIHPRQPSLFDYHKYVNDKQSDVERTVRYTLSEILKEAKQPSVRNLLLNAVIRYMSRMDANDAEGFLRAFQEHIELIRSLPYSPRPCQVLHVDARAIALPAHSIDLIITSPPYINVFNYHQNNRPAMELAGWDLLNVAKSEIGANRKHRQNRFLTVIQYALDMTTVLQTLKRVLHPEGWAILVVGRESTVRGISFKNASLVAALAVGTSGFILHSRQERKFKNKFGEIIYEDILHLRPVGNLPANGESISRAIAEQALLYAAAVAPDGVHGDIIDALKRTETVHPSPIFTIPDDI